MVRYDQVSRNQVAAAVAGVPAVLLASASAFVLVAGFPLSLLLLPVLLPVGGLATTQALSARRVWQGVEAAFPRFIVTSVVIAVAGLAMSGAFLGLLGTGGSAHSGKAAAIIAAAVLPSGVAASLTVTVARLRQPRTIAAMATVVLLIGVTVVMTAPQASHG